MEKIYEVMLIGGGAANLLTATLLAKKLNKGDLVILERLSRVGKKLIATGNGQGNLTNSDMALTHYSSGQSGFFNYALQTFDSACLEKYLNTLGIYLTEDNGKKYPISYEASSVLDLLRENLAVNSVVIKTDFEVISLTKTKGVFTAIDSLGEAVKGKAVILACGGSSAKQFGTDGSAYRLAESFGHKVTPLYPSLVQLKTEMTYIKGLKGIKTQAVCSATVGGKLIKKERGDLLFTDFGVSGSAIFQISGDLLKSPNSEIQIEFLPDITAERLKSILAEKHKNLPYLDAENLLNGLINKQLAKALIKYCHGENNIDSLVFALKNFKLKVTGSLGFNFSQVTKGGIDVKDIDEMSMESKLVKGLYIVGEMLDVDGDCGGYNLQWAFSSGNLAGRSILKNLYGKN